jgi:hypothetical protein
MPGTISKVAHTGGQIAKDIIIRVLLALAVIVVCALMALAGLFNFLANVVS